VRGVRNPSTKARNVRYRVAASKGWTCTFHLLWDKTIVSRAEMETVLIDSGKLVGIGNGRGIGMGRFEVAEFTVIDG
jgi:CRISPR/Cas system endoribonuclease Cas6 (RAMP superfamily)